MGMSQDEINAIMGNEASGDMLLERVAALYARAIENIVPILAGTDKMEVKPGSPSVTKLASEAESLTKNRTFFVFREKPLTGSMLAGYINNNLALDISQKMMGQNGADALNAALLSALNEAFSNILRAFDAGLKDEFEMAVTHADMKFLEGDIVGALKKETGIGDDTQIHTVALHAKLDDLSGDFGLIIDSQGLNELLLKHPMSKKAEKPKVAPDKDTVDNILNGDQAEMEEFLKADVNKHQQPEIPVARFEHLEPRKQAGEPKGIDLILDVPLAVTVELGRKTLSVREILELTPGSLVELEKLAGENVDLLVNGTLFAKGEVVVIDENFGVRVSSIVTPKERIERLGK